MVPLRILQLNWLLGICSFLISAFLEIFSCSSASSSALYRTALQWRKLNSNHRLPLRPKKTSRATRTTVPGHMIATEKHDGTRRVDQKAVEERETTGTPLCCTRERQKSKDLQAKWMFFFLFLIYVLFVGRLGLLPNRTFSQCLKANVYYRCLLGFFRWRVLCYPINCLILVLMIWCAHCLWQDMSTCSLWQPGAVNYAACWGLKVFFWCLLNTWFYWEEVKKLATITWRWQHQYFQPRNLICLIALMLLSQHLPNLTCQRCSPDSRLMHAGICSSTPLLWTG